MILASPLSLKLLTAFAVSVLGTALTFACFATYAREEIVPGWITPRGGLIRVAARGGGIVEALSIAEGVEVATGAPLVTLRLSNDTAAGDVGHTLERSLVAEGAAARAQTDASLVKLEAQRTALIKRRQLLSGELEETSARVLILEERQHLADEQVARGEVLAAKGFLAPQQLDALRSTALAAGQDASQARAAGLDVRRQIGDLGGELAVIPADLANLEAAAAESRASLAQRRTVTESQTTFVATAPIGGRVLTIPVELGQAINAGGTVAVMMPQGAALIAELYAPSRAAGFIRNGEGVRLMYQSYPYQMFGTGKGVVYEVSRTVLAPNEVAIPGVSLQEPVFRIRVRLTRPSVMAYGRVMPLRPGMLLTAEVVTDRRNLIDWLLDPLYAVGRRQ